MARKKLPKSPLAKAGKIVGIIALFLGWIPLIGWGMILFSYVSAFLSFRDIAEGKYSTESRRDAKLAIIFATVSLVLIPLELIAFGLLMYSGLILL